MKHSEQPVKVKISAGPLPHLTRQEILSNPSTLTMAGQELRFTPWTGHWKQKRMRKLPIVSESPERAQWAASGLNWFAKGNELQGWLCLFCWAGMFGDDYLSLENAR